jgi:hypothetical protein
MKMKKFLLAVLTMMCAMTVTTAFTACGDDDDGDKGVTPQTVEIQSIDATYSVIVTEQMAQLCDYTVTYYNKDNELSTETVTWKIENGQALWTKTTNSTKIPAKFGLKLIAKVKEGVQLDDVYVNNVNPIGNSLHVQGISKDNKTMWYKNIDLFFYTSSIVSSKGVNLEKTLEIVYNNFGGLINGSFSIDKDGNVTKHNELL